MVYLWISLVDAVYIRWSMHYIKMENPKKKKNLQLRVMAKLPIKNWWICKSWQYYLNFKLLNLQFLFLTTYNIIIYLSLTHCKRMRKCFSIWLLLYFFSNEDIESYSKFATLKWKAYDFTRECFCKDWQLYFLSLENSFVTNTHLSTITFCLGYDQIKSSRNHKTNLQAHFSLSFIFITWLLLLFFFSL